MNWTKKLARFAPPGDDLRTAFIAYVLALLVFVVFWGLGFFSGYRQALRELHRILKPGGWGIVLSPMDSSRKETFEDDTITDPAERTRVFGQYDHRRIYGRDYADRLRSAGFEVADIDFAASLTEAERRLYALPDDHIYVVYKVRE